MSTSISFVSKNRELAGRTLTIAVGDRVKFHSDAHAGFYAGRVLAIVGNALRVIVERSNTGRGNMSVHRLRNGHKLLIAPDDVYAHVPDTVNVCEHELT